MTDQELKAAMVDRTVLGLTMWGEGRGDWREGYSSVEERIAIGCVIRNRLKLFKRFRAVEPTYRSVCFAPAQFSCWSPEGGAANHAAVMTQATRIVEGRSYLPEPLLSECFYLADGIMAGVILDRTDGATMYYAPAAMQPPGRVPDWALGKKPLAIGDQRFL